MLSGGGSGGDPGGGSGAGGSHSGTAGDGGDGTAGEDGLSASRPALGVRGGEKSGRDGEPSSAAASGVSGGEDSEAGPSTGDQSRPFETSGSGANPEDIPPVDNDDEFARQLRRAAETETDPERRRKLWNEYRRYKGLPERAETQQSEEDETPRGDDS
ncbi:MAG: hypothetical protein J4G09_00695 [Proteobacteria bacterium]|nr:hypothetical protein [Pseudomonadota bacterium]